MNTGDPLVKRVQTELLPDYVDKGLCFHFRSDEPHQAYKSVLTVGTSTSTSTSTLFSTLVFVTILT